MIHLFVVAFLLIPQFAQAQAVKCQKDFDSFTKWRDDLRAEALAKGTSIKTWLAAEEYIFEKPAVVAKDRGQINFYDNFLKFALERTERLLPRAQGAQKLHAKILSQVEAEYGVPAEILLALWGMESDFRTTVLPNSSPVLTSLTTLAYDCRRPKLFREKLLAALTVIEKGIFEPATYLGQWAGEIGGFQFTPPNILQYGVDHDKDGKIDLIRSVPDMLASAANMLKNYGWQRGQDYLHEARLPGNMRWDVADVTGEVKFPRVQWIHWGVTAPARKYFTSDIQSTSLILPMGHLGPAFLTYANFEVLRRWNGSLNNALTVAHLATRISPELKAGKMYSGNGTVEVLSSDQILELQKLLNAHGYQAGAEDGRLGYRMRTAIRQLQLELKLPADSYPTLQLLSQLRERNRN